MSGTGPRAVEARFRAALSELRPSPPNDGALGALSPRLALDLYRAQVASRHLDLEGRRLRREGLGYYTIGSSGHEANVVMGELLTSSDLGLLHYRSGALFVRRLWKAGPPHDPLLDVLLGMVASADDPVSGGRHKVFGSTALNLPPQTSTIASHLPKAVGAAIALDRSRRLGLTGRRLRDDAIICATFGDASLNHASAQSAINTALWAASQRLQVPVLFVCEDNGWGISVRTPADWVRDSVRGRPGLTYVQADGLSLVDAYEKARRAIDHCRRQRAPVFLHLTTIRMFGHAGSDVETAYRPQRAVAADEAADPLLATALLLGRAGVATGPELLAVYDEVGAEVAAASAIAVTRPKLSSAAEIMAPLAPASAAATLAAAVRAATPQDDSPRTLAGHLNQALAEALQTRSNAVVFGEDVAKKGGVYGVTAGLIGSFGAGRVFNTLLDETSILGMAIGGALVGLLPIAEIQFLAYVHNAIDQLRGEAATLQFFSAGAWSNPMVVRIASFAYQRGFGGHFHNDNAIAALREVPGLVLAVPTRGDDAVGMMRAALAACEVDGRVVVFLEPIALYHQRDLFERGDGAWTFPPPASDSSVALGQARLYDCPADRADVLIVTYGNGLWLSLRAAKSLAGEGVAVRVMDLRWLAPLDTAALLREAGEVGGVLFVDEGRRTGGVAEQLMATMVDAGLGSLPMARLCGDDSFVPLGEAWRHILPSEEGIVTAALGLVTRAREHRHLASFDR